MGYLFANFSLPRPLCCRLRPDVRDRQTSSDVRRASSLSASALWRRRHYDDDDDDDNNNNNNNNSVSPSQLQWSRLVHSMRQLVSFWRISGEGSPPSQVTRERVPSCSKGYLLSFSDSTLSCSTTVLRRQTTWANGHSSVYIF